MLAGFARRPDGEDRVLVSSLRKAREVLEKAGFQTTSPAPVREWLERNRVTSEEEAERRVVEQVRRYSKGTKAEGGVLKGARRMGQFVNLAASTTLIDIARKLPYYFGQNYDSSQPYVDSVVEELLQYGYSDSQIVEVPALITSTDLKIPESKPLKIVSSFALPLYSPANGVQVNFEGQNPQYLTQGGIALIDEAAKEIIEEACGIQAVNLESTLPLAYTGGGMHCLAVALAK